MVSELSVERDLRPCLVCDAPPSQLTFIFEKQGVQFRRCSVCGFEFVNPRPTGQWLAARYDDYGAHLFTDKRRLRTDFQQAKFSVERRLLDGLSGRLLDVGCASGAFVKLAQDLGFSVEGIDLSEPAVAWGRATLGLPLRSGDFAAQIFPEAGMDVITMWATLEHLPDPASFLHEAHRVLKPGGNLLVSVPNHGSVSSRLLGRRYRYIGVDHLNYFTTGTLSRLMKRCGFRVTQISIRKFNPVVLFQDLRRRKPSGSTIEDILCDQAITDAVKERSWLGPLRVVHAVVEGGVSAAGLGELLLVRATRVPNTVG